MTDTFTATDLADYIPDVWGQKINDYFKCELSMANFFVNRSDELVNGGDVLHTPNVTAMTAAAKANATAVTLNSPTETDQDLTVDQWFEVSFMIEDRQAAQVARSYAICDTYAKNAGYELAKKLEVAISTLFSTFTTSVGASTTDLADSEIRAAISALDSACVPIYNGETAFFLHPDVFWKDVQSLDKFSLAINSPVNDPTAKRPNAHLYGIPVYVSAQVQYVSGTTGRSNALANKDSIHFATSPLGAGCSKGMMVGSEGIRVQSNYIPEYLGTLTTADILYGVVMNRAGAGIWIKTAA